MTVSTTPFYNSVPGDDVLTSFDFGFTFDLPTDVLVEKNNVVSGATTALVLGEDYTLSGTIASFSSVLETDHTYGFTRDTGHLGRISYPPVWKMRPSAFENGLDVQTYISQETFMYSKVTEAVGDPDQAFTTVEKIIMPKFSGVSITRSGFYIVLVDINYRMDNTFFRNETILTIRLRIGKDGDLASRLVQTSSFYQPGDTDNSRIFYVPTVFTAVYIAAGQKLCVTAEASETPDGDLTIFSGDSTIWVIQ